MCQVPEPPPPDRPSSCQTPTIRRPRYVSSNRVSCTPAALDATTNGADAIPTTAANAPRNTRRRPAGSAALRTGRADGNLNVLLLDNDLSPSSSLRGTH
ncbi:hypothetical protein GCM10010307_79960 [Streptomyces vastus]|uniref:Uncharacterized protein n=1 Tax=Streptomyces vastus TaxID=285451 RepID=A0ABN3RZB5_9ACTN